MRKRSKDLLDLIDEGLSQIFLKEINGRKIVVKNYDQERGFVKWLTVKLLSLPISVYPYVLDPRVRMEREVAFMKEVSNTVATPRLYIVNWIKNVVAREFIDGTPPSLMSRREFAQIGKTLFRVHKEGFALGDTKYSNFIIKDNVVYVIDSEQAVKNAKTSFMFWDLVVFLSTSLAKLTYGLKRIRNLDDYIEEFIDSYVDEGDDEALEILLNYKKRNYWFASSTLIPFPYNLKFFGHLNKVTKE